MNFETQSGKLEKLGWTDFFASQLSSSEREGLLIARVVEPLRGLSRVASVLGEIWAEYADSVGVGVGDWVVGTVRNAGVEEKRLSITRVLERRTKLSRQAPSGKKFEQILCANADTVFVVAAMNQSLHLPGIERAVEAAKLGGLLPAIVLTKKDACENPAAFVAAVNQVCTGLPLHQISVAQNNGLEALSSYFEQSKTVVLLGASGAGKSTLTNHFIQSQLQSVGGTRERDEKGRHTTTARRLHFLPSGGMIVDSPGIRELQLWKEPELPIKSQAPKKSRPPKRGSRFYEEEDDEN